MPSKMLRDDQIADLAFLINHPKSALLNDPATGKTPTLVTYSEYCWKHLGLKTVWTQPLGLIRKNYQETLEWTSFTEEDLLIIQGSKQKRLELMQRPNTKVFFMSVEGWTREWRMITQYHPDLKVSIHDESHLALRGHTSKRCQSWYCASRQMYSVIPATGSLIRGKLTSAYPVIHVLGPQYYGSYEAFVAQHALVDEYGQAYGWRNHEKLKNVLAAIGIRRTFESIHGVENPFINVVKCQMGNKQREKYQEFHESGMLELEDRFLDTAGGGASWIRALQIMAHPENVKLPIEFDWDGKPIAWKNYNLLNKDEETGKDQVLKTYIEDHLVTGDPLVIYASLIPEQLRVRDLIDKMGGAVGLINSTVTGPKRQQIDLDFREGKLQFVVGSPATCSTGFNWQEVSGRELSRILFVSMSPDDTDFTQAYKRGIRRKRKTKLEVVVLEYEDSLDQRIFQLVESKSKEANLVDATQAEVFLTNTLPEYVDVGQPKKVKPIGGKLTMEDMVK